MRKGKDKQKQRMLQSACAEQDTAIKKTSNFTDTHLYKKDDEKVEICDSSKLFKQILRNEVPKSVL